MLLFGFLGYLFDQLNFPLPPFILGFILCPTLETNLRRGMQLYQGDFTMFLKKPIAAVFLLVALASVFITVYRQVKKMNSVKN